MGNDDLEELRAIVAQHEDASGILVQLMNYVGSRVEALMEKLPKNWNDQLRTATEYALNQAYTAATETQVVAEPKSLLGRTFGWAKGERWHKVATGITGALGGLGGLATTLVDLPVTTTLILRSIQQIAVEHGEDFNDPEIRAQCLAVFGMGGPLKEDDDADAGLWAVRMAVSGKMVAEVIKVVLPNFGISVTQKALAQATPLLGAIAGGAVNPIFTSYYQEMAHVHFRLRALERNYDRDQLRACFARLLQVRRQSTGNQAS